MHSFHRNKRSVIFERAAPEPGIRTNVCLLCLFRKWSKCRTSCWSTRPTSASWSGRSWREDRTGRLWPSGRSVCPHLRCDLRVWTKRPWSSRWSRTRWDPMWETLCWSEWKTRRCCNYGCLLKDAVLWNGSKWRRFRWERQTIYRRQKTSYWLSFLLQKHSRFWRLAALNTSDQRNSICATYIKPERGKDGENPVLIRICVLRSWRIISTFFWMKTFQRNTFKKKTFCEIYILYIINLAFIYLLKMYFIFIYLYIYFLF